MPDLFLTHYLDKSSNLQKSFLDTHRWEAGEEIERDKKGWQEHRTALYRKLPPTPALLIGELNIPIPLFCTI